MLAASRQWNVNAARDGASGGGCGDIGRMGNSPLAIRERGGVVCLVADDG
jgi:hypothetical protein